MSKDLYIVDEIKDLKHMISNSENKFGSKNAFISMGNNGKYDGVTYHQFKNDIDSLGTALCYMGLRGKNIAIISENRYEWCVSYLAIVNGTGIVVPLDKELPFGEVENLLERSEAEAVIFSGKYAASMEKISKKNSGVRFFIDMDREDASGVFISYKALIKEGSLLMEAGNKSFINAAVDNEKMSILLFTSGTMSKPKGVMLSHKNICSNIMSICQTVYVDSKDSVLSVLPLHHTYECTIGFLTIIYSGGCISFNQGLKHIARNIQEFKPTILVTVPLLLENIYKKIWDKASKQKFGILKLRLGLFISNVFQELFKINIGSKLFRPVHESVGGRMRMVVSGAAALEAEVSKGFRLMGINVLQGYGLTECSPLVTGNRDSLIKDGSIGIPIPGVEVKIDSSEGNNIGEILVKGSNIMLGYYKDEAETKNTIKDGWFHTGDLGYMDNKGIFYITGRSKNVIVTKNGKNIYPEELESYLNQSPFVLESLVCAKTDDKSGDTIVSAQVFPNLDKIREMLKVVTPSTEEVKKVINDVIKSVNKNLSLYKRIRDFSIQDTEFVKTTTRKIKRYIDNTNLQAAEKSK